MRTSLYNHGNSRCRAVASAHTLVVRVELELDLHSLLHLDALLDVAHPQIDHVVVPDARILAVLRGVRPARLDHLRHLRLHVLGKLRDVGDLDPTVRLVPAHELSLVEHATEGFAALLGSARRVLGFDLSLPLFRKLRERSCLFLAPPFSALATPTFATKCGEQNSQEAAAALALAS